MKVAAMAAFIFFLADPQPRINKPHSHLRSFKTITGLKAFVFSRCDDQFILFEGHIYNLTAGKPGLVQPFAVEPNRRVKGKFFLRSRKIYIADRELSFYCVFWCLRLWMYDVVILRSKTRLPITNTQHGIAVSYSTNRIRYWYFIIKICICLD